MSKTETRNKLLQAALDIFGEQGYEGTTTKEIASRAGVSEMTLFRHFGSKENLLREGIRHFSTLSLLEDTWLEDNWTFNPVCDLRLLAESYLRVSFEYADYMRIVFQEAPRHPELARMASEVPRRLHQNLTEYLCRLHRRGIIPEGNFPVQARIFFDCLYQYVLTTSNYRHVDWVDDIPADVYLDTMIPMFVAGLMQEKRLKLNDKGGEDG
ncbi:MAG: TetR/AcrR family transcriptional regulator [Bacillaceae bacterium]|nr:TetR/AcrR family transcriptional regulator [Bacillaceae bacterium]